jgi:hypothetical protein
LLFLGFGMKWIESSQVISKPGACLHVTAYTLTPEAKKVLSVPKVAFDRACGKRSFWGRVWDALFWRGPR